MQVEAVRVAMRQRGGAARLAEKTVVSPAVEARSDRAVAFATRRRAGIRERTALELATRSALEVLVAAMLVSLRGLAKEPSDVRRGRRAHDHRTLVRPRLERQRESGAFRLGPIAERPTIDANEVLYQVAATQPSALLHDQPPRNDPRARRDAAMQLRMDEVLRQRAAVRSS